MSILFEDPTGPLQFMFDMFPFLAMSIDDETLLRRALYASVLPFNLCLLLSLLSFTWCNISEVNHSGWYFRLILWFLMGACLSSTSAVKYNVQSETISSIVSKFSIIYQGTVKRSFRKHDLAKVLNDLYVIVHNFCQVKREKPDCKNFVMIADT